MLVDRGDSVSMHSLLEIGHREGLHNGLRRLGLDLDLCTKHHALPSLCCCLVPSLDHADPWNLELASALHFLVNELRKSIQSLIHVRLLLLARCRDCIPM